MTKTFIRKHPALSLFALATTLGSAPIVLVATGVLPTGFSQMGALSASAAAIVLAAIEGGRRGVGELLGQGLRFRVSLGWWAFCLLYTAPIALLALALAAIKTGKPIDWNALGPLWGIVPMMLILIVLAGLGEEFGWRGFLVPRLQQRHDGLTTSLVIGVLHSLWHIPLFLVAGTVQHEWAREIGLIPAFLGYSVFVIAWAIQLTWIFNLTGRSVLMVAVVHGAGNAWIGGYFDVSGQAGMTGNHFLSAVMALASLAVVLKVGRGLGRPRLAPEVNGPPKISRSRNHRPR